MHLQAPNSKVVVVNSGVRPAKVERQILNSRLVAQNPRVSDHDFIEQAFLETWVSGANVAKDVGCCSLFCPLSALPVPNAVARPSSSRQGSNNRRQKICRWSTEEIFRRFRGRSLAHSDRFQNKKPEIVGTIFPHEQHISLGILHPEVFSNFCPTS